MALFYSAKVSAMNQCLLENPDLSSRKSDPKFLEDPFYFRATLL